MTGIMAKARQDGVPLLIILQYHLVKHLSDKAYVDIYDAKNDRIMTFAKYNEESRPLFLSLKILNVYELNIYQMALFM